MPEYSRGCRVIILTLEGTFSITVEKKQLRGNHENCPVSTELSCRSPEAKREYREISQENIVSDVSCKGWFLPTESVDEIPWPCIKSPQIHLL